MTDTDTDKDTSTRVVIGVDPGATAGWGILTVAANPQLLGKGKIEFGKARRKEFRTASEMIRWAHVNYTIVMVAIEDQYVDMKDPRKIGSTIKLCRRAGRWEEAACTYNVPYKFIKPSVWQSAILGARLRRDQMKTISKRIFAQMYRVKGNEHIADGCLLGTYEARQQFFAVQQQAAKGLRESYLRKLSRAPVSSALRKRAEVTR